MDSVAAVPPHQRCTWVGALGRACFHNPSGMAPHPLPAAPRPPAGFTSLRSLLLGSNRLADWAAVDALNRFPALEDARLSDNPLTAATPSSARYQCIARIRWVWAGWKKAGEQKVDFAAAAALDARARNIAGALQGCRLGSALQWEAPGWTLNCLHFPSSSEGASPPSTPAPLAQRSAGTQK